MNKLLISSIQRYGLSATSASIWPKNAKKSLPVFAPDFGCAACRLWMLSVQALDQCYNLTMLQCYMLH